MLSCRSKPATETPEVIDSDEITLVVWDQFYRPEESAVIEALNAEFEEAHPGVKIQREVKVLDDLKMTLKLALAEADGPDIAQVNQGRSDMGAMVEADLLLPLNDYLAKYSWGNVFNQCSQSQQLHSRRQIFRSGQPLWRQSDCGSCWRLLQQRPLQEKPLVCSDHF